MPRLRDEVFAYVADFANLSEWDPGIAESHRTDDGPLGVGARFHVGVQVGPRVAPMEYRITAYEPPGRVVLEGEGSTVRAVDDIRFTDAAEGRTRIEYRADISLRGALRFAEPFMRGTMRKVGRKAMAGLEAALS